MKSKAYNAMMVRPPQVIESGFFVSDITYDAIKYVLILIKEALKKIEYPKHKK